MKKTFRLFFFLSLLICPSALFAKELTPQWWSLEVQGGAWLPTNTVTKNSLGGCCSLTGTADFSFLYQGRYGVEVGAGYVGAGGTATGRTSGAVSGDSFNLTLIPIQTSFAFRADFKEDQLLVPYLKAGLDDVFFHESVQGDVTKGFKLGLHTAGGLQILLDRLEDIPRSFEEMGVNDIYFVLEGRYGWINGFGGSGIDLSGFTFSGGLLFEF